MSVRQEGDRVLVFKNGVLIADMPWQAADQLWKAIRAKTKAAEEHASAEQIIADQSLLIRAGAPFGLTNHPLILSEATKEAAWNRDLRRHLPGGIKSTEILGLPRIIQHKPRK